MNKTLLACALIAAYIVYRANQAASSDPQGEDLMNAAMTTFDEAAGALIGPGPIADMQTSPDMLDMLRRRESLKLQPYNLGDGGWTIGYGHFEKTREALPVIRNRADAEALFADDVANRGEKWVKLYVNVDLTQNQFDALVSIAFNMSPQSFKKFADAVNRGEGIEGMAQRSIAWVSPNLQNGIRNRRNDEIQVFNTGVYA